MDPDDPVEAGDAFLFFTPDGSRPPVVGIVGRTESGAALGLDGDMADVVTVHLYLASIPGLGPEDPVRCTHAPFLMEALQDGAIARIGRGQTPPPSFEEGYAAFRAALDGGDAGFFTISPALVLWLTAETVAEATH